MIILSPEPGDLSKTKMGPLAPYISGMTGGLGLVAAAQGKGLTERDIDAHFVTLNLPTAFRSGSGKSEKEWIEQRHSIHSEFIHLVTSPKFLHYKGAYDGNPVETAVIFQHQAMEIVKRIRSQNKGRAIVIGNDWMSGGFFSAYCNLRKIPYLHLVHNSHTAYIPLDSVRDILRPGMERRLYLVYRDGKPFIGCQETGAKNATKLGFVGARFLYETVHDYFLDRKFIPGDFRNETKIKYNLEQTVVLPNGISPDMYPENQNLPVRLEPGEGAVVAKKKILSEFQNYMGLQQNPDAILLFWPSRLDGTQKGIELFWNVAQHFVNYNPDVQIALVGDAPGGDAEAERITGRIACASEGKIAYSKMSNYWSIMGYAAADVVFGASLYEPFGQIDVLGWLYGALSVNRNTGGYHDKWLELTHEFGDNINDPGKGALFNDYDCNGLEWGLNEAVKQVRYYGEHPGEWAVQQHKLMTVPRKLWGLDKMMDNYIPELIELNGGKPFTP